MTFSFGCGGAGVNRDSSDPRAMAVQLTLGLKSSLAAAATTPVTN